MPALKHPQAGTVVHVSEEQAKSLVASGWVSAVEPEGEPVRVKRGPGRPKKSE
ncbi:DUF7302 family protein [Microbacterium sp. KNMS]